MNLRAAKTNFVLALETQGLLPDITSLAGVFNANAGDRQSFALTWRMMSFVSLARMSHAATAMNASAPWHEKKIVMKRLAKSGDVFACVLEVPRA